MIAYWKCVLGTFLGFMAGFTVCAAFYESWLYRRTRKQLERKERTSR